MKKTILAAACAAVAFLALAGPASADYLQGIEENGVGPVTDIQGFIVPGSGTNLVLDDWTDPSWSSTSHNSYWVEATGNAVSDITFDLGFHNTAATFTFDLFAFNNGVLVDSARFLYDNGVLTWLDPLTDPAGAYAQDVASVPEPASIALLGSGLLAAGLFFGWRRKRNASAMAGTLTA